MAKSNKKSEFLIFLSEFIIFILIKMIFLTCKKTYSDTKLSDKTCFLMFWHDRLAMMPFVKKHWWSKERQTNVIISDHKDGEIITRVIKRFNIGAIRGSTSKGGARVLIQSFKDIDSGIDILITPDGPRGPRHSISDGTVIIPQKKNTPIQILSYEASSFWRFNSWDKMILPKPFSTINYILSEPFYITGMKMDEAKEFLQKKMSQINKE
ncbi:lysophospholipid acyltransferase family protein [Campylobacter sp. RM12327]|uniref:Lipoprotein n=1 Tax=Campylobacter sputorum subsp. sputorum TaxID=32024 RepID=A0A381DIF6_9BACT|nr:MULTISPECIES: lysophospholipid acyltransferase family protein [Campylobacter]ASM35443.1 lysophospholipid acyltransferase family protein (DUF374 domain) [Campylobacter sputorum aubsp. sputorum RM3237]ASM37139.1 lysophospholipid acyltransferase family protein (DUF374 domain) [Campylobacter sputorum bv. faecalis CCUG 20703]ASM40394.1 lysophospholipid acyltransferase family protein (DUF374 domain) [Campylobacter sputorum]KAB0582818.1 lysophospholipid acyltransferase family protein [Campylobacter